MTQRRRHEQWLYVRTEGEDTKRKERGGGLETESSGAGSQEVQCRGCPSQPSPSAKPRQRWSLRGRRRRAALSRSAARRKASGREALLCLCLHFRGCLIGVVRWFSFPFFFSSRRSFTHTPSPPLPCLIVPAVLARLADLLASVSPLSPPRHEQKHTRARAGLPDTRGACPRRLPSTQRETTWPWVTEGGFEIERDWAERRAAAGQPLGREGGG